MSELPAALQEIVEDFNYCEGQEKLEYLLEFSESLPPVPEKYADASRTQQVHECMSPVFVYAEQENGCHHLPLRHSPRGADGPRLCGDPAAGPQ